MFAELFPLLRRQELDLLKRYEAHTKSHQNGFLLSQLLLPIAFEVS